MHAVHWHGEGGPVVVCAHGIGGRQSQWDALVARFRDRARLLTFSLAGSPDADPALFSPERHSSLIGYADDLALLCAEEGIRGAVYVGHSLSAMAGLLNAAADPGLFSRLVLLNASPCYVDHPADGYVGGFSPQEVDAVLAAIAADFDTWAGGFGPVAMANPDRPELSREFVASLRALGPQVALAIFRAAFTSDFRALITRVTVPVLVLQSERDGVVPWATAEWLARTLPEAQLRRLDGEGHFPHVVAPDQVAAAIDAFGLSAA